MKSLLVSNAKHISDFKIEIEFNDKKKQVVDFGKFLLTHSHPQYNKYKTLKNFLRFKIENGNLVWGKDWDLIFPVYDLYTGKI